MDSKLERLSIKQHTPKKNRPSPANKPEKVLADSWDDEATSSSSEIDVEDLTKCKKSPVPDAPPPTPASPSSGFPSWDTQDRTLSGRISDRDNEEQRRPEKSTAAAGRFIAAGLGMRTPKKTEEQKAYDKAARENEIRRRNKENELKYKEREEDEKARAAIWES
jgi:hypothetical protein